MNQKATASEKPAATETPHGPNGNGKSKAGEPQFLTEAPAGFEDVGRPEIDGWLKAEEGLVVFGKICGFFSYMKAQRNGPAKRVDVLCLRLFQPCKAAPDQEGGPARQLERGQVIAASMMYALDDVRPYVEHRGDVWIKFGKKAPLGGGQFVWKADVKCRGKKGKPPEAQIQTPPQSTADEDDNYQGVADYDFT